MSATDTGKRDNEREYLARGYAANGNARWDVGYPNLAPDIMTIASTPTGRRLLHWLINEPLEATQGIFGDQRDYYNLGRRDAAEALLRAIRSTLPRNMFLSIMYPEKEELQ